MEKSKNYERAATFFADPKNAGIDKVYFTPDGNMFKAKHYAESWGGTGKVETVHRVIAETVVKLKPEQTEATEPVKTETDKAPEADKAPEQTEATEPVKTETDEAPEADKAKDDAPADERDALVKRYIELFDTKPAHNSKNETIATKIAEKEAELKASGESED